MFTKFIVSAALAGSALAMGAPASAADIAIGTPPPPPPSVPIDGIAVAERPGSAEFIIPCDSSVACDSLTTWCGKHGGVTIRWVERDGTTHGVCIG